MPPPRTPRPSAGGFPQTPAPAPRLSAGKGPLPAAPEANPSQPNSLPRIPLALIDAPTQRFWAFAIYGALWGWKLYDWVRVVENEDASLWLMIKWCFIDCLYIFLLPEMRIPWLELSSVVATVLYSVHFFINFLLMFNIPVGDGHSRLSIAPVADMAQIPLMGFLFATLKSFFDKELAISEHSVRASHILHNNSLIMGKQIINILPEGYVWPVGLIVAHGALGLTLPS
jgi:nucleoporin POM152